MTKTIVRRIFLFRQTGAPYGPRLHWRPRPRCGSEQARATNA
ncbi:hypothetical protein [Brenneria izadpanahii]|nr:hypothetical protein [Brenneria izadpanahii]